jgi:hypothetical protein
MSSRSEEQGDGSQSSRRIIAQLHGDTFSASKNYELLRPFGARAEKSLICKLRSTEKASPYFLASVSRQGSSRAWPAITEMVIVFVSRIFVGPMRI